MTTHFGDYGLTSAAESTPISQPEAGPSRPTRVNSPHSLEEQLRALDLHERPRLPAQQDNRDSECELDDGRVELDGIWYKRYTSEVEDLDDVIRLVEAELSEP
jgi:hypothetical protein